MRSFRIYDTEKHMKQHISKAFFLSAVIILGIEFYNNVFGIVEPGFFKSFQKDSESLTVGRLYRSGIDGPFSYGGFMGWNHPDSSSLPPNTVIQDARFAGWGYNVPGYPSKYMYQYDAFQNNFKVGHYEKYYSQCAGQCLVYYMLGSVFHISGQRFIDLCRMLNAVFTALILCIFLWWAFHYFSLFSVVFSFCMILISQWVIVYASNMLYVPAMFFLPFVVNLIALHYQHEKGTVDMKQILMLTFLTIFLKCILVGFDFIIPALVMAVMPVFFYAIIDKWAFKRLLSFFLYTSIISLAGVVLGLLVLMLQLRLYYHSWVLAADYLVQTSERRTYGNQEDLVHIFKSSRDIPFSYLFNVYANGVAVDLRYFAAMFNAGGVQIRFGAFLWVTLFASVCVLLFKSASKGRRILALMIVTWISLAGIVGWFVVFKYHSISHTHMNFIIWHMPFLLFGVLFIGEVIYQYLIQNINFYIGKLQDSRGGK